jgi:hypothetical protein
VALVSNPDSARQSPFCNRRLVRSFSETRVSEIVSAGVVRETSRSARVLSVSMVLERNGRGTRLIADTPTGGCLCRSSPLAPTVASGHSCAVCRMTRMEKATLPARPVVRSRGWCKQSLQLALQSLARSGTQFGLRAPNIELRFPRRLASSTHLVDGSWPSGWSRWASSS